MRPSFLTAISNLLSRQDQALREIAEHEVNGRMLRLSLQLNRLRTAPEQSDVLNSYYRKTLDALQTLDDEGAYQIPLMLQMLPDSGLNIAQVSETVSRFGALGGTSGELEKIDFSQIENAELHEIPAEHPAFGVLMNYKDYLVHEGFLDRVKELMDLSDSHQDGDKLSAADVAEVKDEKATHLTAAQKVLAVHYLMRWSGIELGQRQGAKQQRFIAALTGISVGTVKEKFPSLNVTGKPYHIDNLEALVPLFESIGALKLVDKIQSDIRFEREERGQ